MKTIILYGELANRFGKVHRLAVRNAAEAIRALRANFRGFESYMANAHNDGVGFRIFVGGRGLRSYDETALPAGQSEIIRLVPTMIGSGSGWVRILIGAVLVTAGVLISGATLGGASPLGAALAAAGVGLIIGGVAQLLSSPPKVPGSPEDTQRKSSYIFNGPENTAIQGSAVPVVYGRMIVGSRVISAGIETHEEA